MSAPLKLAYTHPLITRDAFLAEMQAHQDADQIAKGTYGNGAGKAFRGCAVGCSLHSVKRLAKIKGNFRLGDHAQYPIYLGAPEILARLQDHIFENLPSEQALLFPMRFSAAIQQNADLSGVWSKFAARMLREIVLPNVPDRFENVRLVVARVALGIETGWQNDNCAAARDAAYVAGAAAYAARDAAGAAAGDAAYAARAAAYAARDAAYVKMSDILCQELALAPIGVAT